MSDGDSPLETVDEAEATPTTPVAEDLQAAVVEVVEIARATEWGEPLGDEPAAEEPSPSPAPPTAPNQLPFILEALSAVELAMQRRFDALQQTFEREVRAESSREKVIDRLHAELQEYKNDLLLNTLRLVFIDLIQLHDDIGKIVSSNESADVARLLDLMRGFQQGIEDILYRQGVEPYQNLTAETFDPRTQRAYATVPNDDPTLAKLVAARLRKGFKAGEKIIRPEIVSVYAAPKP
jgi:molecular chaperone GrpE